MLKGKALAIRVWYSVALKVAEWLNAGRKARRLQHIPQIKQAGDKMGIQRERGVQIRLPAELFKAEALLPQGIRPHGGAVAFQ